MSRFCKKTTASVQGVPHLSNADSLRDEGKPYDDEATTAEVYRIAAQIRANNMELTRGRSVEDLVEVENADG